jgi:hypothetical protein
MAEAEGLQDDGEVEGGGWRQEAIAATAGAVAGVPSVDTWVATQFTELVQRLAVATVAVRTVGKEFVLGSYHLDLSAGGSTGTAILVGSQGHGGRHLLAIFVVELVVALIALNASDA